ncbi:MULTISPECIES: hypothetical protein [unclassified Yoonia]|uniref:hypothetical protein n=1 Tax=unclassified Yoonia TaxID=2629118 RepID=UPI002AFE6722|nr:MULTISPECIES: hypothetical protein [unclassified Yoonia]
MDYFANTCASVAGLLLFCIGVIGLSGMPFAENPTITVLFQPLGQSERLNQAYYLALILVGIWLVLYIQARFAALAALVLVLLKVLVA